MKKINAIKLGGIVAVLAIGFFGFSFGRKSEMQMAVSGKTTEKRLEGASEVDGYKKWKKVNDRPRLMGSMVAAMCAAPTQAQIDREAQNPHNKKHINVFVNSIGEEEMMTKKKPVFPQGTVIVKEKLPDPNNASPELLTVMIKREEGFNPENGDWEYMTLNGDATEVTARGRLESCQACHAVDKVTDYVSRSYLPDEIRQKLK
ncbi:MAG: cytochrome P460 family protein [Pyrinomonadaceae bacterium]